MKKVLLPTILVLVLTGNVFGEIEYDLAQRRGLMSGWPDYFRASIASSTVEAASTNYRLAMKPIRTWSADSAVIQLASGMSNGRFVMAEGSISNASFCALGSALQGAATPDMVQLNVTSMTEGVSDPGSGGIVNWGVYKVDLSTMESFTLMLYTTDTGKMSWGSIELVILLSPTNIGGNPRF